MNCWKAVDQTDNEPYQISNAEILLKIVRNKFENTLLKKHNVLKFNVVKIKNAMTYEMFNYARFLTKGIKSRNRPSVSYPQWFCFLHLMLSQNKLLCKSFTLKNAMKKLKISVFPKETTVQFICNRTITINWRCNQLSYAVA